MYLRLMHCKYPFYKVLCCFCSIVNTFYTVLFISFYYVLCGAGLSFFGAASPSEDVYVVAVSAPKSSDHIDYSNLQFYGKRG
jgi:hypothetical protein